jgi:hypothetical protein
MPLLAFVLYQIPQLSPQELLGLTTTSLAMSVMKTVLAQVAIPVPKTLQLKITAEHILQSWTIADGTVGVFPYLSQKTMTFCHPFTVL